ncbi:hypothetical protein [Ruania halotolerans]|uniref:hypothetical protein n=1 Tax=Ruania halotolerans TaxID=2897773 RepID=UPI001E61BC76|nr:hypothetical protein [Ruania halotolerans]UFU06594.1 hypothetical protein LQF10_00320 [Ruania halotolerans]
MAEIPEEVLAGYLGTLHAFVRRARRIEAHSLQADRDQFIKWVHGSAQLTLGNGAGEMHYDVPPEEAFESLAARVRPLLLEQDGIHFSRILAAIGAFGRGDEGVMRTRQVLNKAWQRITGASIVGFAISEPVDGAPLINDVDLAHGWLYGDLVHAAPDVPEGVLSATLNQRYLAAVLIYGQAALAAVATLNVVRMLVAKGLLTLDADAEASPVVVSMPMTLPVVAARLTPTDQLTGLGAASPSATTTPPAPAVPRGANDHGGIGPGDST